MNILAFDTSALTASAAVMSGGIIKGEMSFTTELTHSQTIMPMADELLKKLKMTCADIDVFACSSGPGSFTGIRIGIGTEKGLAYGADKMTVGVSTLEALAYNIMYSDMLVAPIMDARRSQVYNALYRFVGGKAECIEAPRAVGIEELASKLKGKTVFVGDGVRVYRDKITEIMGDNAYFAPPHLCLQRASSVAYAASKHTPVLPAELTAVYLRKPQAEREREEKLQNI